MKVLADHCVPENIVRRLRDKGHRVERVVDVGDPRADDRGVAGLAMNRDAILVTADTDFARRMDFPPRRYNGIIVLKDLAVQPERISCRLERLLARTDTRSLIGAVVIVDRRSVRIRR